LKCRICSSEELEEFLSLGETPLANLFLKKENFSKEKSYPLKVSFCHNCNLVQLMDVVNPDLMFLDYVYFYSKMPAASDHFVDYATDVSERFISNPKKDLVVELGSNDGILLKAFQERGHSKILGIDPAKNVAKLANQNGIPTIADYFSQPLAVSVANDYGKAKVIIGNNVVAHIDDHQELLRGVSELMDEDGVFILEAPYLVDMFENLAYDSIYHEHLSYLAVAPLQKLFQQYGMEIFDVQMKKRQGKSIRVFVCKQDQKPILPSVQVFLDIEKAMGLDKIENYHKLVEKIKTSREKLVLALRDLKNRSFKIAAYGSPARGNTILNYCRIGPDILDFATEELFSKIGLYTPGMHIPVIDIKEARKNPPDYYLMLAWNYKAQILEKESEFVKKGGKFIIPIGNKIETI